MEMNLVLYLLVAVLIAVLIVAFVVFLVAMKCKKRRKRNRQRSDWVTSASIEHLRFNPDEIEQHNIRTSTPHDYEVLSIQDYIRSQNNNGGLFPTGYLNQFERNHYSEVVQELSHKQRTNEPKYIYWETRV